VDTTSLPPLRVRPVRVRQWPITVNACIEQGPDRWSGSARPAFHLRCWAGYSQVSAGGLFAVLSVEFRKTQACSSLWGGDQPRGIVGSQRLKQPGHPLQELWSCRRSVLPAMNRPTGNATGANPMPRGWAVGPWFTRCKVWFLQA